MFELMVLKKLLLGEPPFGPDKSSSGPNFNKAVFMKLDDSINWRAAIQPGSRLDEAMKAAKIHFPPALTDALQDSYDATFVHVYGKVSDGSVKIKCELVKGVPKYTCIMPIIEAEDYISNFKVRDENLALAFKNLSDEIKNAKQSGQINQDITVEHESIVDKLIVKGSNLKDVMKVVCDFYLAKHAPQYAIDYKKIIETGIDERMAVVGEQPVVGPHTAAAAQRRGDEGKGTGGLGGGA